MIMTIQAEVVFIRETVSFKRTSDMRSAPTIKSHAKKLYSVDETLP